MSDLTLEIARLPHAADLSLPSYHSAAAAGLDLLAALPADAPIVLAPGAWAAIPTGIALALPPGLEAQVRPRSGLALKHGVTVLNAPGTIDPDYRGEVKVVLVNLGRAPFPVERGMRIAQLVVSRFERVSIAERVTLSETERGSQGFGSTGGAPGL